MVQWFKQRCWDIPIACSRLGAFAFCSLISLGANVSVDRAGHTPYND
jgi:hypothetical protein